MGRFADHDAGAMIDEEAGSDLCTGMNVDAGAGMRNLADDPRQNRRAKPEQLVRNTMMVDRLDARIAEKNFFDALRGWVSVESGTRIEQYAFAHIRQPFGKIPQD